MRYFLTIIVLFGLFAGALSAQPPIKQPDPDNGPDTQPSDPPLRNNTDEALDLYALAEEEARKAVNRRFEDFSPLRSRRRLFIEFSGGLTGVYRQAEVDGNQDIPKGGHRAPNGINLKRAWLTFRAGYSDIVESVLTLRFNGDYSLLDEEIIEIPEAYIVYNRPFGQFLPLGWYNDSFLFGVESHFFRQHRASETMALGHRAFTQDDTPQFRYTGRISDNFYFIGALSDGNVLGRGPVDDSNNYPLLQDDRTRYWKGLGESREISRYIQLEFGTGIIWDFNSSSFLKSGAHFDPETITSQNVNYVHLLAWGTVDRLSFNEMLLIEGMMRDPFKGGTPNNPGGHIRRTKWRFGVNLDVAFRIGVGDLFAQGHYIHAEDGRMARNAWGVELRYTFELPGLSFLFLRATPMFRYSELTTNNKRNPLDPSDPFGGPFRVSTGNVPGFTLADAAGFAADRREYMIGISFSLARNVSIGFEVVFNEEDFNQVGNLQRDVRNTLYIFRFAAEF